jgi:hypothetical protein
VASLAESGDGIGGNATLRIRKSGLSSDFGKATDAGDGVDIGDCAFGSRHMAACDIAVPTDDQRWRQQQKQNPPDMA